MSKRSKKNRDLSYPQIIDRLKVIMEKGPNGSPTWKKWNQAKLARVMGKDHSTISRWFGGENEMTITSLLSICRAMRVDPVHLFQG